MKPEENQPNGGPRASRPRGSFKDNEREVLDPITHLPLVIHDVTDVDLEHIPPPLSTSEERKRQRALASQSIAREETNIHHHEMEALVREVTQKGWWHDPGVDTNRARVQASIIAGVATAVGSMGGLCLWWFLSLFVGHSKRFHWFDLFILPLGCGLLALLVGISTLSFKLFQTPPDQISPEQKSPSRPLPEASRDEATEEVDGKPAQPSTSDSPESAGWANSLLRSIWPVVNPALFTPLSDILEDSLQSTLPKFVRGVRVADVGQGAEPVRILGIRWLSPGSASQSVGGLPPEEGDFINLEVALAYRAKPMTSTTGLKGRSANLHLLTEFYLSGGIAVPTWVELTGFLATVRMRIQLTPNPPFFAAMKLTLLGKPKITMKCTPLAKDFLNLMDVPGLSNWLQQSVDSVVEEYVAPKSLNLDLRELLVGVPNTDVEALGVVVVTIRRAAGFKSGDDTKVFKSGQGGTKGNTYVTLSWNKWGKFLWATRIINKEFNPVWEETTAVLVRPQEVDAQESLRVQLWDADRFTADDLLGTIDVPLSQLMHHDETHNRISVWEDQLHSDNSSAHSLPGTLLWECGYFDKTTLQQRLENRDKKEASHLADTRSYEEVKAGVETEAEKKLQEAKTREMLDQEIQQDEANDGDGGGHNIGVGLRRFDQTPAQTSPPDQDQKEGEDSSENQRLTSEVTQQKKEDLEEKGNDIITSSPPVPGFPSGILSIRIEQISGLGVQKIRQSGVPEADEGEDEDANDLPSAYCTVLINHQRVYKTRTKIKSSDPYFAANTERFIRSWQDTTVIIAVRDNRLHEKSPILGVVVLPLSTIFRSRSSFNHTLPIVGGIGYGRLKFSLIFRSVQVQLPKRLLGWDVGTLEIQPNVYAIARSVLNGVEGGEGGGVVVEKGGGGMKKKGGSGGVLPSDLAGCHLVFRTRYGKGKVLPFHPKHHHSPHRTNTLSSTNTTLSEDASTTGNPSSISSISATEADAEWRSKRNVKPLRLPVVKRYASCLRILFKRHTLGRDTVSATCTLWLKDIPDEEEVTVQLPIRRRSSSGPKPFGHLGSAAAGSLASVTRRGSKDKGQDKNIDVNVAGGPKRRDFVAGEIGGTTGAGGGDIIPGVMLVLRLRFWHGLSGYHQTIVKHDRNIEDVMEVLDSAEEQEDERGELTIDDEQRQDPEEQNNYEESTEGESDDENSWEIAEGYDEVPMNASSGKERLLQGSEADRGDESEHSPTKRLREEKGEEGLRERRSFEEDAKAQRKKPKDSHRKHRGLMQWKAMRNMAWVGQGVEEKAEKLGHKIKSGFKHEDREAGVEKEV